MDIFFQAWTNSNKFKAQLITVFFPMRDLWREQYLILRLLCSSGPGVLLRPTVNAHPSFLRGKSPIDTWGFLWARRMHTSNCFWAADILELTLAWSSVTCSRIYYPFFWSQSWPKGKLHSAVFQRSVLHLLAQAGHTAFLSRHFESCK